MENVKAPYPRASLGAINVVIRFHRQLSNEEDPPEGSPLVAADAPPPYSSLAADSDGEGASSTRAVYICPPPGVRPITFGPGQKVYCHVAAARGSLDSFGLLSCQSMAKSTGLICR